MRCKGCRFWQESTRAELVGMGECRRRAPAVSRDVIRNGETETDKPNVDRVLTFWPLTVSSDWCGEFDG